MRLALIMDNEEYLAKDEVSLIAVEVVDTTTTSIAAITNFTNSVTGKSYVRRYVEVPEDGYKNTIISNFSECKFKKSTGGIVIGYTSLSNRGITLNTKIPMVIDNLPVYNSL